MSNSKLPERAKNRKKKLGKANPIFSNSSTEAIREKRAPELTKIGIGSEPSIIFSVSLLTAVFLIIIGTSLFFLNITTLSLLISLIIIIVGIVQVIIDLGWILMIKINHQQSITTWKQAFYSVASIRGQKIFIIPIFIDFILILIAVSSLFFS